MPHLRRYNRILPLVLAITTTATATVGAQETTGTVRGVVLTSEGDPLESADVVVEGPRLASFRLAVTDEQGRFQVAGVPPGTYTVRIERIGYRPMAVEDLPVHVGAMTQMKPVRLPIQPANLDPLLLVVESPDLIVDPVSTTAGMNIEHDLFSKLPVERDYNSLLTLVPQVSLSYLKDEVNVAGSTGSENVYFINGVNVTDPHLATGGISLPYNFVHEIRVTGGGYQAEHGRALGAVVDVVTRSGGESLEIEAFGNFLDDGLATQARSGLAGLRTSGFSDYDVGASVGGPLGSSARFFAAYNGRFQNQDLEVPALDDQRDRRITHMFAGRLDWRVARETDLILNVIGDPTVHETVGHQFAERLGAPESLAEVDPFLGSVRTGGITASIQGRTARWSNFLLEGGAALYRRLETEEGRTERGRSEPLFIGLATGVWEGGFGVNADNRLTRLSSDLKGTWFLDDHTLKAGVAYEENVVDIDRSLTDPGVLLDEGSVVLAVTNTAQTRVRNRVPSLFLQDSWAVSDRFTFNVGLRWDGQYFYGVGDTLAQAISDQYQPRLGVVWRSGGPETKVFASAGRFYQQLPLYLSSAQHILFENKIVVYPSDPRDGSVEPISEQEFGAVDTPLSPRAEGIEGEHFDEFIAGFETRGIQGIRFLVRGIRRVLREAYLIAVDPETSEFEAGNPGSGDLSFLPKAERNYTALELTAEHMRSHGLGWLVSYTLSRTRGNYTGLFPSDFNHYSPGENSGFETVEQIENSTGKLAADRPHLFKLFGSYGTGPWTAGTFFLVQSGMPLNEFAPTSLIGRPRYLVPRGSAGRTPTLWDLSLRLTYDVAHLPGIPGGVRLLADLLHIGSPRKATRVDQWRFVGENEDGTFIPNRVFNQPLDHQPPMMLRLGLQWRGNL